MAYRKVAVTAYFPPAAKSSGVDITFNNRKGMVTVGGWYNSCVGIEPTTLSLAAFLDRLGIRPQDIERSRSQQEAPHP